MLPVLIFDFLLFHFDVTDASECSLGSGPAPSEVRISICGVRRKLSLLMLILWLAVSDFTDVFLLRH